VSTDIEQVDGLYARMLTPERSAGSRAACISTIAGVGTAVSATSFSQHDLLDVFDITDPKVRSIFLNSSIQRRYLALPMPGRGSGRGQETQGDLLDRHKAVAVDMGARALQACLHDADAAMSDVRHLCCVTSTGFLTPGLSALLVRELGIDRHCSRTDIVGMGCNAGLNAVAVVSSWSMAHPGELAIVICAEACSAAYVLDSSMRTAVVNSLFGDGAAALALINQPAGQRGDPPSRPAGPHILKFASCMIPEAIDAMRYDWDSAQAKFSFFLDPQVPYIVGAHAELVVDHLLTGTGLNRSDVSHWLIHAGGKKVIDALMVNLGLSRYDVRHTISVLRDYGNVSSGSYLFSYERLQQEGVTTPGEYGVLMTMGPGSTIETALIQW
jgi:3,5-dihydroxyphenylacetyl-CoA synthase